jgi:UDP-N-acetylglucosamine 2-epimerase (non-hydrolysing)/GDP/UDP-N,N'-diacetylbacillosamine 2-epimerase (hydrolysing)
VVTTGRADYGIYRPVLDLVRADPGLKLHLVVSGMHLSPEFGLTVKEIEADGFEIGEKVETLLSSDSSEGIAKSMGLAVIGFAQAFAHSSIDLLVVLGDRFEMHAAALAALPFKIPVAHIHGGEITMGAIDDALRHSMTKLSHLHFVATEAYARRVIQLGEQPWRVILCGAPSLDNLKLLDLPDWQSVREKFGLRLENGPFLLVTFHPVTLEYEQTEWQVGELLAALDEMGLPCLFTMPNADTHGRVIRQMVQAFVQVHPESQAVENLGTQGYFSLMSSASTMVGNSSSGMVEAASFELPVVNIGIRQQGRVSGVNVIQVGYSRQEVLQGIQKAISPGFKASLKGIENPYGRGYAALKIVEVLRTIAIDQKLLVKRFHDLEVAP